MITSRTPRPAGAPAGPDAEAANRSEERAPAAAPGAPAPAVSEPADSPELEDPLAISGRILDDQGRLRKHVVVFINGRHGRRGNAVEWVIGHS